ncbi:hypothetical protein LZ31DRAFT_107877 [Colletotrichum somersetense]|nr:hypothetical protein LZ31DRAFT_107877 [Colletotrichum somersetense]
MARRLVCTDSRRLRVSGPGRDCQVLDRFPGRNCSLGMWSNCERSRLKSALKGIEYEDVRGRRYSNLLVHTSGSNGQALGGGDNGGWVWEWDRSRQGLTREAQAGTRRLATAGEANGVKSWGAAERVLEHAGFSCKRRRRRRRGTKGGQGKSRKKAQGTESKDEQGKQKH